MNQQRIHQMKQIIAEESRMNIARFKQRKLHREQLSIQDAKNEDEHWLVHSELLKN